VFKDDEEYMAFSTAAPYSAYMTKPGPADAVSWVQIDLGAKRAIDKVKLFPTVANYWGFWTDRFPKRFKIEGSDEPGFAKPAMIADHTGADYKTELLRICQFPAAGVTTRYVRLTITGFPGDRALLSKMGVFSGGKDVAVGCPVSVDAGYGNPSGRQGAAQLTRAYRPMGEDTRTDHPENVIPAERWKPAGYKMVAPLGGVTLAGGLFQAAMENNIRYLLDTDTVEYLLAPFHQRAGKPIGNGIGKGTKAPVEFWESYLPGSSAGRFLMGAGNTLRWMEHAELRRRMNAVVDGITACREPDGYIMGYARDTMFDSERGGYCRSWVTQGLIEAGYAGRADAFELVRGYHDWLYKRPELPRLMRGGGLGTQGMTPLTRFYFTPGGTAREIEVVQRYYQENYWLDWLAERRPEAIWLYPYDRPHDYLITNLEAYFDLYRATGEARYLDAMLGAWDLCHDHWEHIGGSIGIMEYGEYPPDSNRLYPTEAGTQDGELCGSVFWLRFNQRFHLMFPEEEKYVAEMEKAIYNIGLANQDGDRGIIHHTRLVRQKEGSTHNNTCCEGQGARLYGSLPEYIYSVGEDGVSVDLFEASSIRWEMDGRKVRLDMKTRFPYGAEVGLRFAGGRDVKGSIRIRVPSWACAMMAISVNGEVAALGKPGTYVSLERGWSEGDAIDFTLPMGFKMTRYKGVDEVAGLPFYALQYGPILMAAVGRADVRFHLGRDRDAETLIEMLKPKGDRALHFEVEGENVVYMPYFEVMQGEPFTCYPVVNSFGV